MCMPTSSTIGVGQKILRKVQRRRRTWSQSGRRCWDLRSPSTIFDREDFDEEPAPRRASQNLRSSRLEVQLTMIAIAPSTPRLSVQQYCILLGDQELYSFKKRVYGSANRILGASSKRGPVAPRISVREPKDRCSPIRIQRPAVLTPFDTLDPGRLQCT
jgi:hypothetical protein